VITTSGILSGLLEVIKLHAELLRELLGGGVELVLVVELLGKGIDFLLELPCKAFLLVLLSLNGIDLLAEETELSEGLLALLLELALSTVRSL